MRKLQSTASNDSRDNDIAISTANLNALYERQISLFEIRSVLLSELSNVVCRDKGMSFEELSSYYGSIFTQNNAGDRDNTLKRFSGLSSLDKIDFCRSISKAKQINQELSQALFGECEKISAQAKGRLAYMQNHYTDAAYLIFSKTVPSLRSSYFSSFQAVCEEVYSGSCEYCILPIENSSDGKLMSFYSMIDKYELKISSVCTVRHSDGQSFTKFALLNKSFLPSGIFNAPAAYLNKRIIEIRVSQTSVNDSPLDNILLAANACGLKIQRVDSLPLSYNENLLGYYIVLGINNVDFKTFLTYIAFEYPQCYIVGIYSNAN